jgi:hypothetical protein
MQIHSTAMQAIEMVIGEFIKAREPLLPMKDRQFSNHLHQFSDTH